MEKEDLGASVPERDQSALVAALLTYLYDPSAIATARANVQRVRQGFVWERAMAPLVEFCRQPVHAADKVIEPGLTVGSVPKPKPADAARRSPHTGIRRDADRVAYYFRQGGATAVIERFRARLDRKRESRLGG